MQQCCTGEREIFGKDLFQWDSLVQYHVHSRKIIDGPVEQQVAVHLEFPEVGHGVQVLLADVGDEVAAHAKGLGLRQVSDIDRKCEELKKQVSLTDS